MIASQRMPRRGFSLIELLVVLGLLIVLATIGVAAFSGTRKVSRLVGTEQLISAMIRQARMTARATGQAVMLYVDPDTRSISGVSRLAMWQSDCENFPTPNPACEAQFGRTGKGLKIGSMGEFPVATLYSGTGGVGRNTQLTRRPGTQKTEGFQFGAVVKAQLVYDPNNGAAAMGPEYLPLLTISADPVGTPPDTDTAFAGLVLRRAEQPMFTSGTPPTAVPGLPMTLNTNPNRLVWELIGWVLPEGTTTPEFVRSLVDAVKPSDQTQLNDLELAQRIDPTNGGAWMDVSLVFSGSSLELWRDGRLIARHPLSGITRIEGYQKAHTLFIGAATIGTQLSGLAPTLTTTATPALAGATTIFDDIQLVRLGVDQPQVFPGGVEPKQGYRVLVHPDGRITSLATITSAAQTGTSLIWSFTGVFDEKEDTADITINPTSGTVSATQVKLSASAP